MTGGGLNTGTSHSLFFRVNGELNGRKIIMQDLHCFVVTEDGRTYTAISGIPGDVGWELQGVVPVGTVISWMFAKPSDGGQNGFSLTGGLLNYTASVFYPDTGDRVQLEFQFKVEFLEAVSVALIN